MNIISKKNKNKYYNFLNSLPKKINHLYYQNRKLSYIKDINKSLKEISEKNNIKFLNKEDFLCDIKNSACFGITDKYQKVYIYNKFINKYYSINLLIRYTSRSLSLYIYIILVSTYWVSSTQLRFQLKIN